MPRCDLLYYRLRRRNNEIVVDGQVVVRGDWGERSFSFCHFLPRWITCVGRYVILIVYYRCIQNKIIIQTSRTVQNSGGSLKSIISWRLGTARRGTSVLCIKTVFSVYTVEQRDVNVTPRPSSLCEVHQRHQPKTIFIGHVFQYYYYSIEKQEFFFLLRRGAVVENDKTYIVVNLCNIL